MEPHDNLIRNICIILGVPLICYGVYQMWEAPPLTEAQKAEIESVTPRESSEEAQAFGCLLCLILLIGIPCAIGYVILHYLVKYW